MIIDKKKLSEPANAVLEMIHKYPKKSKNKIIYGDSEKELKTIIEINRLEGLTFIFAKQNSLKISKGYHKTLEEYYYKNAAYTMRMNLTLKRLSKTLHKMKSQIILFKGAPLIKELLNDKTIRSFVDIDFFIDEKKLLKLHKTLKENGYKTWLFFNFEEDYDEDTLNDETLESMKETTYLKNMPKKSAIINPEIINYSDKGIEKYYQELLNKLKLEKIKPKVYENENYDENTNIDKILRELEKQKRINEKQREQALKEIRNKNVRLSANIRLQRIKLMRQLKKEHKKIKRDIEKQKNNALRIARNKLVKEIQKIDSLNDASVIDRVAAQNKAIIEYDKKYFARMKQAIHEINEYKNMKDVLENEYHLAYKDDKTKILLEAHFNIFQKYYAINFKDMETEKFRNFENIRRISYTDLIPIIAVHIFHHKLKEMLRTLLDLKIIIDNTEVDWNELISFSKKSNTSSYVYALLKIGTELLNLNIPPKAIKKIRKQSSRLQMSLIDKMDISNIISGKKDFFFCLFYRAYLKKGIFRDIVEFIHRSFA